VSRTLIFFIAIITDNGRDSYFSRPMCRQEIQWAIDAGKIIVPVHSSDDKKRIGDFIAEGQKFDIDFSRYDFAQFDRSGPEFLEASLKKIIRLTQF